MIVLVDQKKMRKINKAIRAVYSILKLDSPAKATLLLLLLL